MDASQSNFPTYEEPLSFQSTHFTPLKERQAKAMKEIMEPFCTAAGHKISMHKEKLFLSTNIPRKKEIKDFVFA